MPLGAATYDVLIGDGLLATPLAILFGIGTGWLFNRAKGREMVTGLIAGYFAAQRAR